MVFKFKSLSYYFYYFIEFGLIIDRKCFNRFFYYLTTDIYLLYKTGSLIEFKKIKKVIDNPIIIGGCARSGTTLLLSILSSHPKIHAIPYESNIFRTRQFPSRHIKLIKLYNYVLKNNIRDIDVSLCEKSPRNILNIDDILEYFGENVKIINIVRDGRDVVTSIHPKDPNKFWVTPERWVCSLERGLLYENHSRVLAIRYEDLIDDFNTVLIKICNFINLEYTDSIKQYHKNATLSKIHNKKVEAPYKDSINRWKEKKYKDIIEELLSNERAVELLEYYKYL